MNTQSVNLRKVQPGIRSIFICAAVLASLLLAQPAEAINRSKANKIAMAHLKTSKLTGTVALFGLKRPLPASATVAISAPFTLSAKKAKKSKGVFTVTHTLSKLRRKTWLFWLDKDYQAQFEHPSRLLLIDDATGKIRSDRKLRTYPLVSGKVPPFLASRSAYYGDKYKVFSTVSKKLSSAAVTSTTKIATSNALPADAFKDDCLITATNQDDPRFGDDGKSMRKWAKSVGLPSSEASSPRPDSGPTGASLMVDVKKITKKGCKDVFIYLSGHGSNTGTPAITTAHKTRTEGFGPFKEKVAENEYFITSEDIVAILQRYPTTGFKVKIQGCYSGRFISEVAYPSNLQIMESSSAADQVSYFYIKESKINGRVVENPKRDSGISEFTAGEIEGLDNFVTSSREVSHAQDGLQNQKGQGSLLAWALARSIELGSGGDFSQQLGLTQPRRIANFFWSAP